VSDKDKTEIEVKDQIKELTSFEVMVQGHRITTGADCVFFAPMFVNDRGYWCAKKCIYITPTECLSKYDCKEFKERK
jgi:hypothetical protein